MTEMKEKLAEGMYSKNIDAIAQAHVDAGVYGQGWVKVDEHGNLKRIDPQMVSIHVLSVENYDD